MEEVFACLKGLPRKLKIGAYDWRVVILDADEDGEINLGKTEWLTHTVKLWPLNINDAPEAVGTLLHETLHIIHDNAGLDKLKCKRDEREESIILGFEAGLISFYRDNPKILSWFKKWLR